MFDQEPDRDPHDECRHTIQRLQHENAEMRRTFGSHPLFAEKDAEIAGLKRLLNAIYIEAGEGTSRGRAIDLLSRTIVDQMRTVRDKMNQRP